MAVLVEFDAILNLLFLVVVITLIARRFRLPYTIALIVAGLLAATFPRLAIPEISPDIFLAILLPPILFQAALELDVDGFLRDWDAVLGYAAVVTVITIGLVAGFAYFLLRFEPIESLLLGIIIAPTDPVAVVSAFREAKVDRRFQLIVEGEALLNDGVAIVAYTLVLTVIRGGAVTPAAVAGAISLSILGGVSLGILGGYAVHYLIRQTDDKFAETILGFLLSYGIFRLADELGASGVIATVVAGLILNYRVKHLGGLSEGGLHEMTDIWEFVGFIATSVAFIFIGLYIDVRLLLLNLIPVAGLVLFILATRYVEVGWMTRLLNKFRGKVIPRRWVAGMWWAGLRGGVSVVLVLSLSTLVIPHESDMRALTYGVVLVTNVLLGMTVPYAIGRFKLSSKSLS